MYIIIRCTIAMRGNGRIGRFPAVELLLRNVAANGRAICGRNIRLEIMEKTGIRRSCELLEFKL